MAVLVMATAPASARALGGAGRLRLGLTLGSSPGGAAARGGGGTLRQGVTVPATPARLPAVGGRAWRLALVPDVIPDAHILKF